LVLLIALQSVKNETTIETPPTPSIPAKTETQITREIGQQLGLPEGEIPLRVTLDDNGQTAHLTPGKYLVIMLGNEYNWDIQSSDETVLAKRDIQMNDEKVQAVYQIVHAGKAVLNATGNCKSGTTCATPSQSFTLNIEGDITDDVPASDLVK